MRIGGGAGLSDIEAPLTDVARHLTGVFREPPMGTIVAGHSLPLSFNYGPEPRTPPTEGQVQHAG